MNIIEKNGTQWVGWIPEHPNIKCEKKTREAVQKQLPIKLHETLVEKEKEWEKQLKNDLETGKLDHLIEKAVENYNAGKYSRIVTDNE